ncbi:MAG TPA: AmmeMemoRadiSam system protein B [Bacteroidota bacterium]|nr:AmmeMemoRadiSam system protein B [Bacteroidota bacterium]
MTASSTIRPPAVAGLFYPAQREVLSQNIKQLLAAAPTDIPGGALVALVSPHAGYQYSGPTAACAFSLLQSRRFDVVVIVSPSHREYFDGISIYDGKAYRTPLGDVMIDEELRARLLLDDTIIESSQLGHGEEHAVEVQLPFLQSIMGEVSMVPIVMGDQRREYCLHLGEKLAAVLKGRKALLIASTDLSHYHPHEIARNLDRIFIDDVAAFDCEGLMRNLELERTEACGGGPTVAVLLASRSLGADSVQVLHHCNSGDVTGEFNRVVGYLSAAVLQTN